MYMIKQITPKARELKGTPTKLRCFKSLGSLNQLKHIMIRKRGDTGYGKGQQSRTLLLDSGLCSASSSVSLSKQGVVMTTQDKISTK